MKRRLLACLLSLCVICLCGVNVLSAGRTGSLTVVMLAGEEPASGGALALYYIGPKLDGEPTPEYAQELERRLQAGAGIRKRVDTGGKTVYSELEPGFYLVSQPEAAPGYRKIRSFLITVPMQQDGELIYDICAYPKVERLPQDPSAPGTGQDMWPFGLLSLSAAGLLTVIYLRRQRK